MKVPVLSATRLFFNMAAPVEIGALKNSGSGSLCLWLANACNPDGAFYENSRQMPAIAGGLYLMNSEVYELFLFCLVPVNHAF
jgi:hypothetical protein